MNESWSMDFIADQLHDGRKIRTLAFIDNFTRECLATTAGANLRNEHLVNTLMQITKASATPQEIFFVTTVLTLLEE